MAMLLVMAVLAMGSTWMVLTRLNAAATEMTIAKRSHNAKVLAQAKLALIGYVAAQANKTGENNPGNVPCPENPGDFYNADPTYEWRQGLQGSGCGSSVKVGRFPWRTLGLDKLVDADGEALWYVVSPNWGGSGTVINSDSTGQLTVDGVASAAIALIIAPGAVISVQAASGCTAWNQTRPTNATPDWRNYLECENATSPADYAFVTTGPSGSFNDQVMVVTAAEMLAPLEAAIANRIEREIAPVLQTVYTEGSFGLSGSQPVYPYPAPFADPGSASYRGATSTSLSGGNSYGGLLPVNYVSCTEGTDARCAYSTFHAFSKASNDVQTDGTGYIRTQSTCSWSSDTYTCTGEYFEPFIAVTVNIRISDVAMGMRTLDTTKVSFTALNDTSGGWGTQTIPHTVTPTMNSDGSMTLLIAGAAMPDIDTAGWGSYAWYRVSIQRSVLGDHAFLSTTLDTSNPADKTWFMRNRWYRMTYYAVASGHTSAILPSNRSCTTGSTCLTVTSTDGARPITPAGGQRVILILAGRSLSSSSRPNGMLTDYLESGNATGAFIRQVVSRNTFNDRVVVVSSN